MQNPVSFSLPGMLLRNPFSYPPNFSQKLKKFPDSLPRRLFGFDRRMFCRRVLVLMLILCVPGLGVHSQAIGVNIGCEMSHPWPPSKIAEWLERNSITKVKMTDRSFELLKADLKDGTEVTVNIPAERLGKEFDPEAWYVDYIDSSKRTSRIKYVAVGTEPSNEAEIDNALDIVDDLHGAQERFRGQSDTKFTILFGSEICYSSTGEPSDGDFKPDIKEVMIRVLDKLNKTNAPCMVNIQPFKYLRNNQSSFIQSAFLDNKKAILRKEKTDYRNLVDHLYETAIGCLAKVNLDSMAVIIGEVGWSTDGDVYANVEHAERFYSGLLGHKGIEAYIYSLTDDDRRNISGGKIFERHWGFLNPHGTAKFPIDLSGKGRLVSPEYVPIETLPRRWCVAKESAVKQAGESVISELYKMTCDNGDCSTLNAASTCGTLGKIGRLSYAINSYFQNKSQNQSLCDFNGLAEMTLKDPSQGNCTFPVQILPISVGTTALPLKRAMFFALCCFSCIL